MPLLRRRPGPTAGTLATLLVGMLGAGCAAADDGSTSEGPGVPPRLVVFAASSLTEAFEALGAAFATIDGGVPVVLNPAGSQTLAAQLIEGAPADVFAAADATQLARVADAGLLAGPAEPFATNRMAIAVEPGNPRGITDLADLARDDLLVVLPAAEVPAGRYARAVLAAAGVTVVPVSLEPDVRAALSKVTLGEADATIVYASDVAAAGDRVTGVAIPADLNVIATYPIAVLAGAPGGVDAAARFVAFVRSAEGRRILADHGFDAP